MVTVAPGAPMLIVVAVAPISSVPVEESIPACASIEPSTITSFWNVLSPAKVWAEVDTAPGFVASAGSRLIVGRVMSPTVIEDKVIPSALGV